MTTPTLLITDGTTEGTVDLLALKGWLLKNWKPSVPEPKGGGVFRDSPLVDGRKLVYRKVENVIDTFDIVGNSGSQDDLIATIRKTQELLERAVSYWTSDWQNAPVWMEAKAACETSPRYATIVDYRLTGFGNPYTMPFFSNDSATEAILAIEHTIWQETKPGDSGNCVQLYSETEFPAVTAYVNGTFTPSGAKDDVTYSPQMKAVDDTATVLGIGFATTAPFTGLCQAGIIFNNVTVPVGSDIKKATLTVECTAFSNPKVSVKIQGQALGGGEINSVTITNPGSGYNDPKVLVSDSGGMGNGAIIMATLYNGMIDELNIIDGGYNYVSPVLTIKDTACRYPYCGKDATATATAAAIGADATTFSGTNADFINRPRTEASALLYVDSIGTATKTVDVTNIIKEIVDTDYWDSGDKLGMFLSLPKVPSPLSTDFLEIASLEHLSLDPPELYIEYSTQVVQAGRDTTCSAEVYVANKSNKAPVDFIYYYDADAVTWSPNMYEWDYSSANMPLFQDDLGVVVVPAVGDYLYFGSCPIDTTDVDYGPFCSLIYDLYSAMVDVEGEWEYYDGSWTDLINSCEDINMFMRTGVGSMVWRQPPDWTELAINGHTGFWIRFKVTSVGVAPTSPYQWHRSIYTVLLPYIDIVSEEVPGDIPALARVIYEFASCDDRSAQTVVMGLRSLSRGENFNAYLNASDVQTTPGIQFSAMTGAAAFADDLNAPTGRAVLADSVNTTMELVGWWYISGGIAKEFLGTYHAYLRVKQTTAATGTVKVKLRTKVGYSNIYTDPVAIVTGEIMSYLDMGQLTIPFADVMLSDDSMSGAIYIAVYASIETTEDFYIYDLILIPADEWSGSCTAYDEYGNSILYYGTGLDVDAIRNPKKLRSALYDTDPIHGSKSTTFYRGEIQHIYSGDPIFQANADQRLWFFSVYSYGGSASYIENCGAIRTERSARYLLMRGVE